MRTQSPMVFLEIKKEKMPTLALIVPLFSGHWKHMREVIRQKGGGLHPAP
jgi:hypothetical protein